MTFFKAKNRQILREEITFDEIKEIFIQCGIDSSQKLRIAKINKTLQLPEMQDFEKLCRKKTGKSVADFFGFKRTNDKSYLENRLLGENFIKRMKDWCNANSVTSVNQYRNLNKITPKDFPSAEYIRQIYGLDFFNEIFDNRPCNYEYLAKEEARKICIDNNIFTSNATREYYN